MHPIADRAEPLRANLITQRTDRIARQTEAEHAGRVLGDDHARQRAGAGDGDLIGDCRLDGDVHVHACVTGRSIVMVKVLVKVTAPAWVSFTSQRRSPIGQALVSEATKVTSP